MKYLSKKNWSFYIAILVGITASGAWNLIEVYIDELHPIVMVMIALVLITLPILGVIYAFHIKRLWIRISMIVIHSAIGAFSIWLGFMIIYILLFVLHFTNMFRTFGT